MKKYRSKDPIHVLSSPFQIGRSMREIQRTSPNPPASEQLDFLLFQSTLLIRNSVSLACLPIHPFPFYYLFYPEVGYTSFFHCAHWFIPEQTPIDRDVRRYLDRKDLIKMQERFRPSPPPFLIERPLGNQSISRVWLIKEELSSMIVDIHLRGDSDPTLPAHISYKCLLIMISRLS